MGALLSACLVGFGLAPVGASPGAAAATAPEAQDTERAKLVAAVLDLASPEPTQRRAAERSLARILRGAADAVAIAAALESAPREAQRRMARLVGAEDRLLGLAVELAVKDGQISQRVGREALEAQLLRWSVSAFDEPESAAFDPQRQRQPIPSPWREVASQLIALDPLHGGPLMGFDRLDRLGQGPAPIIVDPRLAQRFVRRAQPAGRPAELDSTWSEMLEALCLLNGAAYQVQGYRFPGEVRAGDRDVLGGAAAAARKDLVDQAPQARAWVHVVPPGTTELAPPGRDLRRRGGDVIIDWCLAARREGDLLKQGSAARALAALDWSAAVLWLEQRWLALGDVAALEGLVAAAARGRVAPSLQRADVVRRILALVDGEESEVERLRAQRSSALADESIRAAKAALNEAQDAFDARAQRFAAGLKGLAPVAVERQAENSGQPLLPVVFEGFERAAPTGRWLRLVIAEGMGVPDPGAARWAARALRGEVQVRSRRQALRALLQTKGQGADSAPVVLEDADALFREASEMRGLGLELGLAGVQARDAVFVGRLRAEREATSEILVWGAMAAQRGGPTAWWLAAVKTALAQSGAFREIDAENPFERAADLAPGNVREALKLTGPMAGPGLPAGARADLERVLLRAGLAQAAPCQAALERATRVLEAARPGADDPPSARAVEAAWLDLAALVEQPELGMRALGSLEGSLLAALELGSRGPGGSSVALARATERAVQALRRRRLGVAADDFLGSLRGAARRGDHPLASRFYAVDWPAEPGPQPLDLMRIEPLLPPR